METINKELKYIQPVNLYVSRVATNIDIEKLKKDYEEARELILKNIFDLSPIRCHEMAFLINAGMQYKGYNSSVKNGIFEKRLQHSWVNIPDKKLDKIIIDFRFLNYSPIFSEPLYTDSIILDPKRKSNFKIKDIDFILTKGIPDLAERLFTKT
ncbi:MAG: hypothetical protein PHD81_03825 [Candidatus Nanoarchaeia archaeon]|nr:hypothetical protein [Candidatus Nanoarchaeia archaeon]MDD5588211.1 hypothetical protein [Candidatus Nanoarchaeia archaeon]